MLSTFIKISSFIIVLLFCSTLYAEDVYIYHQNYVIHIANGKID